MLGLAVAVRVADVGRTACDADGEEGQKGGDQVGSGVHRFRDEAEAVGGEARRELDRDERDRGKHGDERRAALRAHAHKLLLVSGGTERPDERVLAPREVQQRLPA